MVILHQRIHVNGVSVGGQSPNGAVDRRRFSVLSFALRYAFPFSIHDGTDSIDDTDCEYLVNDCKYFTAQVVRYLYTHLHFKLVFTIHI